MELCTLATLPAAAAMCEILDSNGEALRPSSLSGEAAQSEDPDLHWWRSLAYVSTVDLLWYRLLCTPRCSSTWKEMTVDSLEVSRVPLKAWRLTPQLEADVLLPCSIVTYSKAIQPEHTRVPRMDERSHPRKRASGSVRICSERVHHSKPRAFIRLLRFERKRRFERNTPRRAPRSLAAACFRFLS